jgi:hypothetical protein
MNVADFLILLYFSQGGGKEGLASTQEIQNVNKDLVSTQETNNISTLLKEEADEARKMTSSETLDPFDSLVPGGSSRNQPFLPQV